DDDTFDITENATSELYIQGDTIFGGVVERCLRNGWTLIPQERGDRRRSSIIDGRALKWGEYIEKPPTVQEVRRWALQAPSANGAILMGKPSGNVFCFDIDVLDEDLVYDIIRLADDLLGRTPFSRVGQYPKHALFYRVENEADLPANKSYRFDGSEDMLEIQARGRLITAYGYHHKTECYFKWEAAMPSVDHVSRVPVVTPSQIEEFVDRVRGLRPFSTKAG